MELVQVINTLYCVEGDSHYSFATLKVLVYLMFENSRCCQCFGFYFQFFDRWNKDWLSTIFTEFGR